MLYNCSMGSDRVSKGRSRSWIPFLRLISRTGNPKDVLLHHLSLPPIESDGRGFPPRLCVALVALGGSRPLSYSPRNKEHKPMDRSMSKTCTRRIHTHSRKCTTQSSKNQLDKSPMDQHQRVDAMFSTSSGELRISLGLPPCILQDRWNQV